MCYYFTEALDIGVFKMKANVTEQGVLIPKEMLQDGTKQVEIHIENGRIIVIPLRASDPVFNLGKNPVDTGVSDAADSHDKYLYDNS